MTIDETLTDAVAALDELWQDPDETARAYRDFLDRVRDEEQALAPSAQPKSSGARAAAKPPLRQFGEDPESGTPVVVKEGRFGLYITDGQTSITLPRGVQLEELTEPHALELLAQKRAEAQCELPGVRSAPPLPESEASEEISALAQLFADLPSDPAQSLEEFLDHGSVQRRLFITVRPSLFLPQYCAPDFLPYYCAPNRWWTRKPAAEKTDDTPTHLVIAVVPGLGVEQIWQIDASHDHIDR